MDDDITRLQEKIKTLQISQQELVVELKRIKELKRKSIWAPAIGEDYYSVGNAGLPELFHRGHDPMTPELRHGNIFKTREQTEIASEFICSTLLQLRFAFSAGGDGRQIENNGSKRGWLLGRNEVICARTLPYPSMVYFPTYESAEACHKHFRNRGGLLPG